MLEEQARSASGRPRLAARGLRPASDWSTNTSTGSDSARNWRDRAFAAELLGRVGDAKAVPALLDTVKATRTEDADVREIALRALARIADPRAVEPLIRPWPAPRSGWLPASPTSSPATASWSSIR